jgi:transcriptional regulator with XRE-family HTH domain
MTNKGLKISDFAHELGESKYRIQNILSKKQKASEDVISKIVGVFNVNATWLITGNGPIFSRTNEEKQEIKEINEDRAAYGADNSPSLDGVFNILKNHWDKLSDEQKRALMVVLKEMVKNNNEILLEENRRLKDFLIKIATNQPGEIPSNVVQRLTA